MPTTLAAHTGRRRPRSTTLRLRVAERVLALVLAAIEGRIPQVRPTPPQRKWGAR